MQTPFVILLIYYLLVWAWKKEQSWKTKTKKNNQPTNKPPQNKHNLLPLQTQKQQTPPKKTNKAEQWE